MTRTNYNLVKFIRNAIYSLKREYGGNIVIYILGSANTNLKTGVKSETHTSYPINRAIVLPNRVRAEIVRTISVISANKKLVQGGSFESGIRNFIIDRRDAKAITEISKDDWLIYEGKRYDVKQVEEFEQSTAWLITAKEVEGLVPPEDIRANTESRLSFTGASSNG